MTAAWSYLINIHMNVKDMLVYNGRVNSACLSVIHACVLHHWNRTVIDFECRYQCFCDCDRLR
jgi:hypothetical protein